MGKTVGGFDFKEKVIYQAELGDTRVIAESASLGPSDETPPLDDVLEGLVLPMLQALGYGEGDVRAAIAKRTGVGA